jgi:hypothetical protein
MPVNQQGSTFPHALLMTLLGGATLGGFAVAFASTRTWLDLRNSLKAQASRFNPKAGPSAPANDETVQVAFI